MGNPQERSLAWLAGIVDGEGSITVQCITRKNGNVTLVPFAMVVNSDHGILNETRRILDELGLSHRTLKHPAGPDSYPGKKQCFNVRVDGQEPVARLIEALTPYLKSDDKLTRSASVLKFIRLRQSQLLQRDGLGRVKRLGYTREQVAFAVAARSHKRAKSSEAICQAPNVIG